MKRKLNFHFLKLLIFKLLAINVLVVESSSLIIKNVTLNPKNKEQTLILTYPYKTLAKSQINQFSTMNKQNSILQQLSLGQNIFSNEQKTSSLSKLEKNEISLKLDKNVNKNSSNQNNYKRAGVNFGTLEQLTTKTTQKTTTNNTTSTTSSNLISLSLIKREYKLLDNNKTSNSKKLDNAEFKHEQHQQQEDDETIQVFFSLKNRKNFQAKTSINDYSTNLTRNSNWKEINFKIESKSQDSKLNFVKSLDNYSSNKTEMTESIQVGNTTSTQTQIELNQTETPLTTVTNIILNNLTSNLDELNTTKTSINLNISNLITETRPTTKLIFNLSDVVNNSISSLLNDKNLTVFNISRINDPANSIALSFDNKAKEIILLSTAFATMLLSTCFLIFILWFCCFTIMKDKKVKSDVSQIRKSIKETEINLNELGGMKAFKKDTDSDTKTNKDIFVRDDSEYVLFKSSQKKKKNDAPENGSDQNKQVPPSSSSTTSPEFPLITTNFLNSSKQDQNQQKTISNKYCDDAISYHPYDILDISSRNLDTSTQSNKKKFKEKLNRELSKSPPKNISNKKPAVNEAFEADYEYFNNQEIKTTPMNNYILKQSSHKVGSDNCRYINFNTQSTEALNRAMHKRIKRDKSGRISKNSSLRNLPKLTREQIEREFYEYTLECRKRLNEIFLNSPSSDTFGASSSDQADVVETNSSKRGLIITTPSNYYNSLKSKLKRPGLSSVTKTKRVETEQIWQI